MSEAEYLEAKRLWYAGLSRPYVQSLDIKFRTGCDDAPKHRLYLYIAFLAAYSFAASSIIYFLISLLLKDYIESVIKIGATIFLAVMLSAVGWIIRRALVSAVSLYRAIKHGLDSDDNDLIRRDRMKAGLKWGLKNGLVVKSAIGYDLVRK